MRTRWLVYTVAVVSVVVGAAAWVLHQGPDGEAEIVLPEATATRRGHAVASAEAPGVGRTPAKAPSAAGAPHKSVVVQYTFDAGIEPQALDAGGRLPLTVRRAGGALSTVAHANGLAVRYPGPCAHYGAESCERAILQSGPADLLNPARKAFSYGASVLVEPSETSKGANVVQKGFSVGDSQFKLQVDGTAGHPSCVIVGTSGPAIYVALASQSVADGRWHQLTCSRSNSLLTVVVDGEVGGSAHIPAVLSITNPDPLCIGGKGTSANNDQFVGVIDDVFFTEAV